MAVAFSAQSAVHWLPPEKREWERSSLPEHTKRLWEFEWSKSSYNYECSDYRLQIVPIYFWPGERLDIPCKMCELALALNGKVKYWAVAEDVTTFLENPQVILLLFLSEGTQERGETTKDYKLPQSFGQYNQDKKYTHIFKEKPVYLERDGKLSILRAGPASQGVYFCFDESSLVILVYYCGLEMYIKTTSVDDCGHTDFIQPSSNWRFHYQPAFRRTRPEYCDATNEGPCNAQNYLEVYAANYTGVYQEKCSLDYCR
uniref:AMOP domain-containing protein n=1 Tax=Heterorhabditis bacteriophora TaxID=37862 RepID=A0A1I7WBN1_HETBA